MRACLVLLVSVLLAASCSEPPTKEHDQAEGALAAARAADAATYAPTELAAAESALKRYDVAVAQSDYRLALSLALEAREAAYAAAKRAGNEKAAARSHAEALLSELDVLSRTASARLSGAAGPRPTGAAAERLREALAPASVSLQEARSLLSAQDYRGVTQRISAVTAALRTALRATSPSAGRRGR